MAETSRQEITTLLVRICSTISKAIERVEELILAVSILGIALLAIANVIARTLFSTSLAFASEVSQFLIIAVCFIGMSYAAAQGRHIRMSAIYDQFSLPVRKVLMLGITLVTGALMITFGIYSCYYVFIVYRLGGRYPTLDVPFFVVYLVVPIGFFLAAIQYVLAFVRNLQSREVYLAYHHQDHGDASIEMATAGVTDPVDFEDQRSSKGFASKEDDHS